MTLVELERFSGACVRITVDGQAALGILEIVPGDGACITSLCFTDSGGQCPQIRHQLSAEEVAGLQHQSQNYLASNVAIATTNPAV